MVSDKRNELSNGDDEDYENNPESQATIQYSQSNQEINELMSQDLNETMMKEKMEKDFWGMYYLVHYQFAMLK